VRFGVVRLRLPWPLTPGQLLWFAQRTYQSQDDAKRFEILEQWEDDLGRQWVTIRMGQWDGTGYLAVRGFTGWLVYHAHRRDDQQPGDAEALEAAARSVRSVVPQVGE
jgi:hypothetical protein